jgi:hypothetical protein
LKKLAAPFLVLALAVFLVAGCGSKSQNKAYAGSVASFAKVMNQICASATAKIKPLRPHTTSDLVKNGPQVQNILNHALDQIGNLQPPDQIKSQVSDFVSKERDAASKIGDLVSAAKAGDTAKIQQIGAQLTPEINAAHQDARTIGAPACAKTNS